MLRDGTMLVDDLEMMITTWYKPMQCHNRALTLNPPHQSLELFWFLFMYKTKVRKDIFHNFAIYDLHEHSKICQKITKIMYFGGFLNFFLILSYKDAKLRVLNHKFSKFFIYYQFMAKMVVFWQIFKCSCRSYIAKL